MESRTRRKVQILVLCLIGLGALALCSWVIYHKVWGGPPFKETTIEIVFERRLEKDGGKALPPSSVVSVDGQYRLNEVFSPERMKDFGADTIEPDGVGLKATFVTTHQGRIVKREEFLLPAWKKREETTYPARRRLAEKARDDFNRLAASFVSTVPISYVTVVVLDTTSGVNAHVQGRVREIVATTSRNITCRGDDSLFFAYHLTELEYQGGRHVSQLCPQDPYYNTAVEWLVKKQPSERGSSVLGGLVEVLSEISKYRNEHPNTVVQVHIFTDGFENTRLASVYPIRPGVITDEYWKYIEGQLDKVFDVANLRLHNVEITLHGMPVKSVEVPWMKKIHTYIAGKLQSRGATVTVESF